MNNYVFYNKHSCLKGIFEISSDNGNFSSKKEFIGATYPVIKLKNEEYYFINQSWYIKDGINHLTEFSNSCK